MKLVQDRGAPRVMDICTDISARMGTLFRCAALERNGPAGAPVLTRVSTPFLYPDGDVVDVYVRQIGERFEVSDAGDALGWLRMNSLSNRRTKKQTALVADVVQTLGLDLREGQVFAQGSKAELPDLILRVSQAVIHVGDVWFTMRTRALENTAEDVEDFLMEKKIRFRRNVPVVGRSGSQWDIHFETTTPLRESLVMLLATGSKSYARVARDHAVAAWVDLHHLPKDNPRLQLISLVDDTGDVWEPSDLVLLENFSEVVPWSDPMRFENVLGAAA